ncbi:MAG: hypothetical protein RIS58_270 [Actinomycetota bacterium]
MKIGFWGANRTVTGSRTILDTRTARILIDCGLFHGDRATRAHNRADFPVDPSTIDAVILTHAHVDHSGFLPGLVRDGFRGTIWCTPGTADVCALLLPDAARLEEEEAHYANVHHTSRHKPALPLFTTHDADRALRQFRTHPFNSAFTPVHGVRATFTHAGHIIGASTVTIDDGETRVVFSGDLGRPRDAVMHAPEPRPQSDILVVESTYGDRRHPPSSGRNELAEITRATIARGGTLLIPAFAVGRTQEVLFLLGELRHTGSIPDVPVFLNSPMATSATDLFLRYRDEHRLTAEQCERMAHMVHFVRSVEESKDLTHDSTPKIVISASGMATGGRVLHHLIQLAPDSRNTVLFVGHQAIGTRGNSIVNGAKHVRIYGQDVEIRARIEHLNMLSAHADAEDLVRWLGSEQSTPIRTYLNHGEPDASAALQEHILRQLGWQVEVPAFATTIDTDALQSTTREAVHRG